MKPDLIITWPRSMDYPVWRGFLRRNRDLFGEVFIALMDTNRLEDYTPFLKAAMEEERVTFVEDYLYLEDWRNSAVNACLTRSKSEWVFFTEQDFFFEDFTRFMSMVDAKAKDTDAFFYYEGQRIHPACMFVRRSEIDKTRKNFGIIPNLSDHFSMFVYDLQENKLREHRITQQAGCEVFHMNGLTHNYHLIADGQPQNIYQPGAFLLYNSYARLQSVIQCDLFIALSLKADMLLAPVSKFFVGSL